MNRSIIIISYIHPSVQGIMRYIYIYVYIFLMINIIASYNRLYQRRIHDRWHESIFFFGLVLCHPSVNFFFDKTSLVQYNPRITNRKNYREKKSEQ